MRSLAWQARAACRHPQVRPEWFAPEPGQTATHARRVCAGCPVREACLAYALETEGNDRWGVFGGLSARERRSLVAERRRAAA